jgi:hypothetical protein
MEARAAKPAVARQKIGGADRAEYVAARKSAWDRCPQSRPRGQSRVALGTAHIAWPLEGPVDGVLESHPHMLHRSRMPLPGPVLWRRVRRDSDQRDVDRGPPLAALRPPRLRRPASWCFVGQANHLAPRVAAGLGVAQRSDGELPSLPWPRCLRGCNAMSSWRSPSCFEFYSSPPTRTGTSAPGAG